MNKTKPHTKRKVTKSRAKAQPKNNLKRALKFLPALVLFVAAFGLHQTAMKPRTQIQNQKVLSYATSISISDLLAQTNAQRVGNAAGALSLNSQLDTAAQTKANDMVNRNYWSHVTPDGVQPWVFITNTGYQYSSAGENLAYGFSTSADTITGWMNSPPHRENLLNPAFTEVGFGFANSANYVNDGQQTVVVAMYATPQGQAVAAAPVATAPPTPAPTPTPTAQPQTNSAKLTPAPAAQPVQTPVAEPTAPTPTTTAKTPTTAATKTTPVAASTLPATTTRVASVRRIQVLTGGNARWSSTLLVFAMCGVGVLWALERGRQIKRLMRVGEHFMLSHLHIDLTVIAFIFVGWTLMQTSGVVR